MSVSRRLLFSASSSSTTPPSSPLSSFRILRFLRFLSPPPINHTSSLTAHSRSVMAYQQRRSEHKEQMWQKKQSHKKSYRLSPFAEGGSALAEEAVTKTIDTSSAAESSRSSNTSAPSMKFGTAGSANYRPAHEQKAIWKQKSYETTGTKEVEVGKATISQTEVGNMGNGTQMVSEGKSSSDLSKLFKGKILENFAVDNSTYLLAQIRATFYPKFENEKSDQEVRMRMIETVSKGLATLEVSLKHSGSLFMYAGHAGGAYAKNSYGNIYTAVGVFVLGRTFLEAWGARASKKQAEFNEFLERNRMCISMELVTAVLGDHGQRPQEDYVVVTAVTELGEGKPKFYSTPDIIAFCRKWRLPTNHVWLFSTRKSVTSFFAVNDALCEEGTATPVCKALDVVADVSVPGSKDHIKVQGEILEGLVARIVSHESPNHMEQVLRDYPSPPLEGADQDWGPSLREICAANRSDEKQQIKALLLSVGSSFCPNYLDWFGDEAAEVHTRTADRSVLSKFLQAHPSDYSTSKLQEMIRLMREKRFPAAFKFYYNFQKADSISSNDLLLKMVIHVHSDSAFRRYQKEMRYKPELWPLYRGFFVDVNLFKASKEKVAEIARNSGCVVKDVSETNGTQNQDGLADEDANLMIKLKFLPYKLRTFLIRNGLTALFEKGPSSYATYYRRQMDIWNTSKAKREGLCKMLDEWAKYITNKYKHKKLSSTLYLSEAEPFLEQYAKHSPENQSLIGSAGDIVRAEDFLAIIEGGRDEEGDIERETPSSPDPSVKDTVPKSEGLIVFFPGIPGCAKSALCKEIKSAPGGLGDDRPVLSMMGDLIKGKYWRLVADERRKKPYSIMLADKNAPNEDVWRQIEDMCRTTTASAVPVVPDCEGTETNPFSLDALAVFIFRVLNRNNHPGNLDKSNPRAGSILLMFYHLYEGKSRAEFETELIERFGYLVKMPLLKTDRSPLPDSMKSILEEGINLYKLHTNRYKFDSSKGDYARDWATWERKLREVMLGNAEYLNSIQVPFEYAVKQVLEQLRAMAKGDYRTQSTKKKIGPVIFAAVNLPVEEIHDLLGNLAQSNPMVEAFIKDKNPENSLKKAHMTLAHKKSHGIIEVCKYAQFAQKHVPVEITALLYSDKLAALEAHPGSVGGEKVTAKNTWPHVTLWTAEGIGAKEANTLPQLLLEGKATRIEINPPATVVGTVQLY